MEEDSAIEEASTDTVQKDCIVHPSKPTYLDAVLQGKFNSFHALREHREAIMMKERVNTADDASQDTLQITFGFNYPLHTILTLMISWRK